MKYKFSEFEKIQEEVEAMELRRLESMLKALFNKIGIGFEFSTHFNDRINDARNKPTIYIRELGMLFQKVFVQHKDKLKNMTPEQEGLMKDTSTAINLPFVMKQGRRGGSNFVRAKTVIRKKQFGNDNFNDITLQVK